MNNQASALTNNDLGERNPLDLFKNWLTVAEQSEPNDPSAMSLATVDPDGLPNVRVVLMRRYDERGIVFFTNFESAKGNELLASRKAAASFHWKSLRKAVRFRGLVEPVSEEEADEYFYTRPRGSQIASSASKQSRALSNRNQLEAEVAALSAQIGTGDIKRPPHWSGFRIMPLSVEFWSDGEFRLHDRVKYSRTALDQDWQMSRLYP
ncbi:MAG: pyridoxamine 5'-phosphate oxidase [Pseudomonadota bacterium]